MKIDKIRKFLLSNIPYLFICNYITYGCKEINY